MTTNRVRIAALVLAFLLVGTAAFAANYERSKGDEPSVTIRSDGADYEIPKKTEDKTQQDDDADIARLGGAAAQSADASLLQAVGDRETLLELLLERGALYDPENPRWDVWYQYDDVFVDEAETAREPAAAADASNAAGNTAEADSGSHSETNEQVKGVSEGDIVKTDGQYIYALAPYDNFIRIIRADGAQLEVSSTVAIKDVSCGEFYLVGADRLVAIGDEWVSLNANNTQNERSPFVEIAPPIGVITDEAPEPIPGAVARQSDYAGYGNSFTTAVIFDISDKTNPVELRRITMEGYSVSTRIIGSALYMATNKHIWAVPYDMADSPSIMPHCRDTAAGGLYAPIPFDNMYIVPDSNDTSYLMVGAVDIYGDEPIKTEAYLGAGNALYMSRDAMYVSYSYWNRNPMLRSGGEIDAQTFQNRTEVLRFAIDKTDITYTGKGSADGMPINQYSMDEHNGYFRIATTEWGQGTFVTVMDASNMETVGRTEAMAPNELMRSMRFMGDMGYVVTFENTDPLFTIDLKDPRNPTVLGELKIPGFSQYLHPVGDGLLMGIGRDTQEIYTRDADGNEIVIGFTDVGLKVSLFDVSDPYSPKELDIMRLGDGWAEVTHNPRALMADSARGRYGFNFAGHSENGLESVALILSCDDGKLSRIARLSYGGIHSYGSGARICYIGGTLYVVHGSGVEVFDYNTFEKLGPGLTF